MADYRGGLEFLVNTETLGAEQLPTITRLSSGGFVVSWQGDDTSLDGIKAQIFDASGAKVGSEFLVNTATLNDQRFQAITTLPSGGFVVSWSDGSGQGGDASGWAVKAQIFDALGAKVGSEFLVNTTTVNDQNRSSVTSLASGGFVVSWEDFSGLGGDASNTGIKAQIFDASGAKVGSEFLVNTQTLGAQTIPTIASLASGGFVASWADGSGQGGDASGFGVKAQLFNSSGAKVGSEFLVNTATLNTQSQQSITALSSGGFVISWTDASGQGGDADGSGIKAQIFNAAGAKVGSEFLVNTATLGSQTNSSVIALSSGGFVVSWADPSGQGGDASDSGIKAQVFDASGAKVGSELLINAETLGFQGTPTITSLASGDFVVSWTDESGQGGDAAGFGIKARIFSAVEGNQASNDFDGDGRSDILWRHSSGTITDWLGTDSGGFANNGANAFFDVANEWQIAGTGDFNGDGKDDILWRHSSGTITDWLGTDSGGFANNGANAFFDVANEWQIAGTGDFNGDGKDDILWRHSSGTVTDWLGTASGGFANNGANAFFDVANEWQIAGIGDFNGDGKDDILWRHSSGTVTDWLGTDSGGFANNGANAFFDVANEWQIAGTGDFNGDGRDDILWRHSSGTITDWLGTDSGDFANNGANAFFDVANEWQIAGTGDFNGDGKDDILWRHSSGTITDWLGTDSGGFANNGANAFFDVANDWMII